MRDVLVDYKLELVKRRRRIRDLSVELGMSYCKTSRILNGYDNVPVDFDRRVQGVFARWDKEAGEAARLIRNEKGNGMICE